MTVSRLVRCAVIVGLCCRALPAAAQESDPVLSPWYTTKRPVEVLFGVDHLTSWLGQGRDLRLSVSIPKNEKIALELFGGVYRGDESGLNARGIYGVQIRQRLMRDLHPGRETFVTYGALGVLARNVCSRGNCTKGDLQVLPPFLSTIGFGVQQTVASRLAIRGEVQGGFFLIIPVGLRFSASVAIPLGPLARARPASR